MAADEFFGCLLTSFGIPMVLILYTIILYPLRIITLIISASFWLVSLLLSSVLWFAVVPLKEKLPFGVIFSVLFQETIRLGFIVFLHKIYRGIKLILLNLQDTDSIHSNTAATGANNVLGSEVENHAITDNGLDGNKLLISDSSVDDIFNVTIFAYVGGLGFGIMSGLFATLTMLTDLEGPGTIGYKDVPDNFICLYAVQTLLVVLNHTAYSVIMSRSYQKRSFVKIGAIVGLHLLYSCLSFVNSVKSPAPEIVLAVNFVFCVIACCWAFREAGGRLSILGWAISLTLRGWVRNGRQAYKGRLGDDL